MSAIFFKLRSTNLLSSGFWNRPTQEAERRRWDEKEREERQERQRLVLLTERLEEELNRRKEAEARLTALKAQREKETGLAAKMKDLGTYSRASVSGLLCKGSGSGHSDLELAGDG